MIDVMTIFIRIMLIAIVLISIMNVMLMAVYERIREIGTIAAIGTPPARIRSMFILEGLCMGVAGAAAGALIGAAIIGAINLIGIRFDFGLQKGLLLTPVLRPADLVLVLAYRHRGGRCGQPPARNQGVADGADRCAATCLDRKARRTRGRNPLFIKTSFRLK